MNALFAAALELQRFFEARAWRFCFIGGLAVQRWGEPRLTLDVDCTVLTGFGQEERYVDEILAAFAGRVDHPRAFALAHRVLLVFGSARVPIDIALGAMPFEERCVERASPFDIGDRQSLTMCSAEDLVVFKAFAGRDRDWLDIEGIVLRQRDALDADVIWRELIPLLELKGDTDALPRLQGVLASRLGGSQ